LSANSYAGIFGLNDSIGELKRLYGTEPRLLPSYLDLRATPGFTPQPELAEQRFKAAVDDDPQSAIAHLGLANFYLQTERPPEAEQEFIKASTLGPDSYEAKSSLAFFYATTQKFDLAEKAYTDLANSRSGDVKARIILADFYSGSGKPDKSIDVLQ